MMASPRRGLFVLLYAEEVDFFNIPSQYSLIMMEVLVEASSAYQLNQAKRCDYSWDLQGRRGMNPRFRAVG
jgi:hypothetical protein